MALQRMNTVTFVDMNLVPGTGTVSGMNGYSVYTCMYRLLHNDAE